MANGFPDSVTFAEVLAVELIRTSAVSVKHYRKHNSSHVAGDDELDALMTSDGVVALYGH